MNVYDVPIIQLSYINNSTVYYIVYTYIINNN